MTQAVVKSPVGGDYLSNQCRNFLMEKGIEIVPACMVGSKDVVKSDDPPVWKRRFTASNLTESWMNYMVKVGSRSGPKMTSLMMVNNKFIALNYANILAGSNARLPVICLASF